MKEVKKKNQNCGPIMKNNSDFKWIMISKIQVFRNILKSKNYQIKQLIKKLLSLHLLQNNKFKIIIKIKKWKQKLKNNKYRIKI